MGKAGCVIDTSARATNDSISFSSTSSPKPISRGDVRGHSWSYITVTSRTLKTTHINDILKITKIE